MGILHIKSVGTGQAYATKTLAGADLWLGFDVMFLSTVPIDDPTGAIGGFATSGGTKISGWFVQNDGGTNKWWADWADNGPFGTLTTSVWYHVDYRWKPGTPITEELWVDGVDQVETFSATITSTVGAAFFGLRSPTGGEELFIRGITVGTSRGGAQVWETDLEGELGDIFDTTVVGSGQTLELWSEDPLAPTGRVLIGFDDTPLEPYVDWTRIDSDDRPGFVAEIEIVAGKQEEFDKTETNHATIRFNDRLGLLDPNNTASPWFGKLNGKQILLQLYNPVDSTWYSRFRGVIDKWGHDLNPATRDGVSIVSDVALECVGIFDYLAGFGLTPGLHGDVGGPDGVVFYEDGEVNVRQEAILADAGIDATRYVVFEGNVMVAETLYDMDDTALVALSDACDAETPAALANRYEDRFGRYVFHGRQAALDPDTVAAGAGDAAWDFQRFYIGDGAAIAGDADYAQIRPPLLFTMGRDRIINVALVTPRDVDRTLIAGLVKTDAASVTAYGVHSYTSPDSINAGHKTNADTAVQDLGRSAQFLVDNYAEPQVRLQAVTLKALRPDDARAAKTWEVLSKADIADAAAVRFGYPEGAGVSSATNLAPNGGFETNATGWVNGTRSSVQAKYGGYSYQAVTAGAGPHEGVNTTSTFCPVAGSTTYTCSVWVYAPNGAAMELDLAWYSSVPAYLSSPAQVLFIGTGAWQRVSISGVSHASSATAQVFVRTASAQAITFYVDGVQIELGSVVSNYVETDGAAVTSEQRIQGWRQIIRPLNPTHDMVELTLNVTPAPTVNPYND